MMALHVFCLYQWSSGEATELPSGQTWHSLFSVMCFHFLFTSGGFATCQLVQMSRDNYCEETVGIKLTKNKNYAIFLMFLKALDFCSWMFPQYHSFRNIPAQHYDLFLHLWGCQLWSPKSVSYPYISCHQAGVRWRPSNAHWWWMIQAHSISLSSRLEAGKGCSQY